MNRRGFIGKFLGGIASVSLLKGAKKPEVKAFEMSKPNKEMSAEELEFIESFKRSIEKELDNNVLYNSGKYFNRRVR